MPTPLIGPRWSAPPAMRSWALLALCWRRCAVRPGLPEDVPAAGGAGWQRSSASVPLRRIIGCITFSRYCASALDDLESYQAIARRLASRPVQPRAKRSRHHRRHGQAEQRPKTPEKQALYYSGKKKTHTDKNVLVAGAADGQVLFLSGTYPGKTHDKRIADEEQLNLSRLGPSCIRSTATSRGMSRRCTADLPGEKSRGRRANGRGETGQPQAGGCGCAWSTPSLV